MPPNRIVALLTPVIALAAGVAATWLADNARPGHVRQSELQAVFVAGLLAVLAPAAQWLHGFQKYEARSRSSSAPRSTPTPGWPSAVEQTGRREDDVRRLRGRGRRRRGVRGRPRRGRTSPRTVRARDVAPPPTAAAAPPLIERLGAAGLVAPRDGVREAKRVRPAARARVRAAREGVVRRPQRLRPRPDDLRRRRHGHPHQLRALQAAADRQPQPLDAGRRPVPAHVVGAPGRGRRAGRLLAPGDQHAHGVRPPGGARQALRRVRRCAPLQRHAAPLPRPTAATCSRGRGAGRRSSTARTRRCRPPGAGGPPRRPAGRGRAQRSRRSSRRAAPRAPARRRARGRGAAPRRGGTTARGGGSSPPATAAGARCTPEASIQDGHDGHRRRCDEEAARGARAHRGAAGNARRRSRSTSPSSRRRAPLGARPPPRHRRREPASEGPAPAPRRRQAASPSTPCRSCCARSRRSRPAGGGCTTS